jgi:(1->4)-alpha-D-glucan 1-alpha-D-glucosylmutase
MQAYAIKAAREGKEQSNWLAPDDAYESALADFVARLLDRRLSAAFIDSMAAFASRLALVGALKSLVQVTLKMTVPGIPDFYQGSEFWDLSLVDPDNRRPVDFAARRAALAVTETADWSALAANWADGRIKLALTRRLLALRRQYAAVFTDGSYLPLEVTGPHRDEIVAFARISGREAVIVATGRLFGRATDAGRHWPDAAAWDASVSFQQFRNVRNLLTVRDGTSAQIADIFDAVPIAVLHGQYAKAVRAGAPRARAAAPPAG